MLKTYKGHASNLEGHAPSWPCTECRRTGQAERRPLPLLAYELDDQLPQLFLFAGL